MGSDKTYDPISEARAKFGVLTGAEEKILRAVAGTDAATRALAARDASLETAASAENERVAADLLPPDLLRADLLRWICASCEARRQFAAQPYKRLARVLRAGGDDAGARTVLIAMEDARLKFGGLGRTQRIAQRLLRLSVRYGYQPFHALRWMALFVILGAILFSWGNLAGVITPVERKNPPLQIEPFEPFIYSLDTFVPFLDLRTAQHWLPDANARPTELQWPGTESPAPTPESLGTMLRWYLWLHILLGWFFVSMFIAAITGLVRHD